MSIRDVSGGRPACAGAVVKRHGKLDMKEIEFAQNGSAATVIFAGKAVALPAKIAITRRKTKYGSTASQLTQKAFGFNFKQSKGFVSESGGELQEEVKSALLRDKAAELGMNIDDFDHVRLAFVKLDSNGNGTISKQEMNEGTFIVMSKLHDETSVSFNGVEDSLHEFWAEKNEDAVVDFLEFVEFFAKHRFSAGWKSPPAAQITSGLSRAEYHDFKLTWSACTGGTGETDGMMLLEHFAMALQKLLKVPANLELPLPIVRRFFAEIDGRNRHEIVDGVSFEPFLRWWVKRRDSISPWERFYQKIRLVCIKRTSPETTHHP